MEEQDKGRRSSGLAFAEKQLLRHGWKKGKGLGKQENGISEAIKVKVKCGTAGVGHDSAEQFTFHWWDHLFNSSAANITIESGQDGVKVEKVSERDGSVANKKPRKMHGEREMLYGRFVKAATLTSSGEEPLNPVSPSDSSDEDKKLDLSTVRRLTDEELVQACGGRTAHKGARHGLTMSAKLARLEEQEKAFLAGYVQPKADQRETDPALDSIPPCPKRKKKAKRHKEGDAREAVSGESLEAPGEEDEERPKKKKKKKKRKEEERENMDGEPSTQTTEMKTREKAKRKSK